MDIAPAILGLYRNRDALRRHILAGELLQLSIRLERVWVCPDRRAK